MHGSRLAEEKAMATHSSILAWKTPWMEEPSRLQSTGSLRVGHDWATSLSLFTSMHWRRKWHPLQCSCLENPRDGEPGGLPSMGSHRVGHDWSDLAAAATGLLSHTVISHLTFRGSVNFFQKWLLYHQCMSSWCTIHLSTGLLLLLLDLLTIMRGYISLMTRDWASLHVSRVSRTSSQTLRSRSKSGKSCLVPDLRRKVILGGNLMIKYGVRYEFL